MQCHLLVMVLPGPSDISEGLRALQRCRCSYSNTAKALDRVSLPAE